MAMTKLEQAHQETLDRVFCSSNRAWQCERDKSPYVTPCWMPFFRRKLPSATPGWGIGKTYAYLGACVLLKKHRPLPRPNDSSIHLQRGAAGSHHPGVPALSLSGFGGGRYPCFTHSLCRPKRERTVRLRPAALGHVCRAVQDKPKNPLQRQALDSLRWKVDLDTVPHLSGFDRRLVCVPKTCLKDCPQRTFCRYHRTQQQAGTDQVFLQICNHNYLLADAAHRQQGLRPLLRDYQALIVDEAHKLPEAARQMYGESLSCEDLRELCRALERERLFSPAQRLRVQAGTLWDP